MAEARRDEALLQSGIPTAGEGAEQISRIMEKGTPELQRLLKEECDVIFECKFCRNLFRSIINFVSHKRGYCRNTSEAIKEARHSPARITPSPTPENAEESRGGSEISSRPESRQSATTVESATPDSVGGGASNGPQTESASPRKSILEAYSRSHTQACVAKKHPGKNGPSSNLRILNPITRVTKRMESVAVTVRNGDTQSVLHLHTLPSISKVVPHTTFENGVQVMAHQPGGIVSKESGTGEEGKDRVIMVYPQDSSSRYLNMQLRHRPHDPSLSVKEVDEEDIRLMDRLMQDRSNLIDIPILSCTECTTDNSKSENGGKNLKFENGGSVSFSCLSSLAIHVSLTHSPQPPNLQCYLCLSTEKTTIKCNAMAMKGHIAAKHTDELRVFKSEPEARPPSSSTNGNVSGNKKPKDTKRNTNNSQQTLFATNFNESSQSGGNLNSGEDRSGGKGKAQVIPVPVMLDEGDRDILDAFDTHQQEHNRNLDSPLSHNANSSKSTEPSERPEKRRNLEKVFPHWFSNGKKRSKHVDHDNNTNTENTHLKNDPSKEQKIDKVTKELNLEICLAHETANLQVDSAYLDVKNDDNNVNVININMSNRDCNSAVRNRLVEALKEGNSRWERSKQGPRNTSSKSSESPPIVGLINAEKAVATLQNGPNAPVSVISRAEVPKATSEVNIGNNDVTNPADDVSIPDIQQDSPLMSPLERECMALQVHRHSNTSKDKLLTPLQSHSASTADEPQPQTPPGFKTSEVESTTLILNELLRKRRTRSRSKFEEFIGKKIKKDLTKSELGITRVKREPGTQDSEVTISSEIEDESDDDWTEVHDRKKGRVRKYGAKFQTGGKIQAGGFMKKKKGGGRSQGHQKSFKLACVKARKSIHNANDDQKSTTVMNIDDPVQGTSERPKRQRNVRKSARERQVPARFRDEDDDMSIISTPEKKSPTAPGRRPPSEKKANPDEQEDVKSIHSDEPNKGTHIGPRALGGAGTSPRKRILDGIVAVTPPLSPKTNARVTKNSPRRQNSATKSTPPKSANTSKVPHSPNTPQLTKLSAYKPVSKTEPQDSRPAKTTLPARDLRQTPVTFSHPSQQQQISKAMDDSKCLCRVCNLKYPNLPTARRHLMNHLDLVRFVCTRCQAKSFFCADLRTHLKQGLCSGISRKERENPLPLFSSEDADALIDYVIPEAPGKVINGGKECRIVSLEFPEGRFFTKDAGPEPLSSFIISSIRRRIGGSNPNFNPRTSI